MCLIITWWRLLRQFLPRNLITSVSKGTSDTVRTKHVQVRPCPRFPDYFCINFTYIYYLYYYYTNPTAMKHGSNEIRKNHESKTVRAISNKHQTEIIWPYLTFIDLLQVNHAIKMQYLNMLVSHDIVTRSYFNTIVIFIKWDYQLSFGRFLNWPAHLHL